MTVTPILRLLLVSAVLVVPFRIKAQDESHFLVFTNANVIDGVSEEPIRHATVIVREGRIVSVAASSDIPAAATVLDLKDKWLLPGLIDAHVHLNGEAAARTVLASGVTTVRTGGSARFLDIGIRDLNHAGVVDLPDVVAAGYQVIKQLNERFFVDFPQMTDLTRGVSGEANVRRVVRAMMDRGVNVIKILATERSGLPEADPLKRMFTDEELNAAVDEAHKTGIPVMAHAQGDEGAAAAVRAGVRSIEHGTFLSDRTLALMKERRTFFVPTIAVNERDRETGGPQGSPVVFRPRSRDVASLAGRYCQSLEIGRTDRSRQRLWICRQIPVARRIG